MLNPDWSIQVLGAVCKVVKTKILLFSYFNFAVTKNDILRGPRALDKNQKLKLTK